MASGKHLKILRRGIEHWNRWREKNMEVRADLSRAYLAYADLGRAILWNCDLENAILAGANLVGAQLNGASLWGAELRRADLRRALLMGTNLIRTDLYFAQFAGAIFHSTVLVSVDLSRTQGLSEVTHIGPSAIGTDTLEMTRRGLLEDAAQRSEILRFYRGAGVSQRLIDGQPPAAEEKTVDYYSCFISYSHADKAIARRLHDELQDRGIRCWLDEHDLKPGDRILDVVGNAIRAHDKILLCCSRASLESWWVKDEIRKAQERERRDGRDIIIPLNLDGYLLAGWDGGLAADLRSRLAADFTGWQHDSTKFGEQLERVLQALRAGEDRADRAAPPDGAAGDR